jgi:hypothetical protein
MARGRAALPLLALAPQSFGDDPAPPRVQRRTENLGGYADQLYDGLPCPGTCTVTEGTPVGVSAGSTTPNINFVLQKRELGFTDVPLVAGVTAVKAAHIVELREAIMMLRARYLGERWYSWTDPTLVPAVTPVRAAHVAELRAALAPVYTRAALPAPTYSSPLLAGTSAVRVADIEELRAAILALW